MAPIRIAFDEALEPQLILPKHARPSVTKIARFLFMITRQKVKPVTQATFASYRETSTQAANAGG